MSRLIGKLRRWVERLKSLMQEKTEKVDARKEARKSLGNEARGLHRVDSFEVVSKRTQEKEARTIIHPEPGKNLKADGVGGKPLSAVNNNPSKHAPIPRGRLLDPPPSTKPTSKPSKHSIPPPLKLHSRKPSIARALRLFRHLDPLREPLPHLPTELWLQIFSHIDPTTLWTSCRQVSSSFRAYAEDTARRLLLPQLRVLAYGGALRYSLWPAHHVTFLFKDLVVSDGRMAEFALGAGERGAWGVAEKRGLSLDAFLGMMGKGDVQFAVSREEDDEAMYDVWYDENLCPNWVLMRGVPSRTVYEAGRREHWGSVEEWTLRADWRKMLNEYVGRKKTGADAPCLRDPLVGDRRRGKKELEDVERERAKAKMFLRFMPKSGGNSEWTREYDNWRALYDPADRLLSLATDERSYF